MYERSAIVLERYFSNILGYYSENNLKVNFENYCSLVEKIDKFQQALEKEEIATNEFSDVTDRLKTIQKTQEKLYQKNANLEFNRNILFNNIGDKLEDIENCLIKIENGIDKNEESLKKIRVDFINTLNEYNEKNTILAKSQKEKKNNEKLYKDILEISFENIENINEFVLEVARNFNSSEFKEKITNLMIENGKDEKIPFDSNVIALAADLGTEIYQKEVECYIEAYDGILKIFDEIENDEVSIEKFKKKMRNTKTILHFLSSVKEYLIQFLDYERMMSLSGKKTHSKLMELACENFKLDVVQINNLYELILKEISNKATQKIYKELYNKSYLLEIKREEESLKKEKNKVDSTVATVLGSNYWRIDGIKNIYTVFYKEISETFGRDLDLFEVPNDEDTDVVEEKVMVVEDVKPEIEVKSSIVEEINEEELPQLFVEEEIEPLEEVKVIKKERKRGRTKKTEKIEEPKVENVVVIEKEENIDIKEEKVNVKEFITEEVITKVEEAKKEEPKVIENSNEEEILKKIEEIPEIDYSEKLQKIAEENVTEISFDGKKSNENIIETSQPRRGRRKKTEEIEQIEVKLEKGKGKRVKPKETTKSKKTKTVIIEENTLGDLEKRIQELDDIEIPTKVNKAKKEETPKKESKKETVQKIEEIKKETTAKIENFESESVEETPEVEESLFGNIKSNSGRTKLNMEMIESLEKKEKSTKKGLLSSLMKMNSKKGKRALN